MRHGKGCGRGREEVWVDTMPHHSVFQTNTSQFFLDNNVTAKACEG